MVTDWISAVSSVGFPIVAYFYTTWRMGAVVDRNTDALHQLREEIRNSRN